MLDRIVEVFCEVDDFCKAFVPQWEASLLGTGGPAPRGPQPGLSSSEMGYGNDSGNKGTLLNPTC
jgi:hypothetical protein